MSAPQARRLPPINVLFLYMEKKAPVTIWLVEQTNTRIEGVISGFDEFMNLVVDDATEVHQETAKRTDLGRILLKGDNVTLVTSLA